MNGLLRKYKISKILDNVKLTKSELEICEFFNRRLSRLHKRELSEKLIVYLTDQQRDIFEYYPKENKVVINRYLTNDIENILNLNIFEQNIRSLITEWIESLYDLHITYIMYRGREFKLW